jgi:hypothetical protein
MLRSKCDISQAVKNGLRLSRTRPGFCHISRTETYAKRQPAASNFSSRSNAVTTSCSYSGPKSRWPTARHLPGLPCHPGRRGGSAWRSQQPPRDSVIVMARLLPPDRADRERRAAQNLDQADFNGRRKQPLISRIYCIPALVVFVHEAHAFIILVHVWISPQT